jgi:hypothetical protein
MVRQLEENNLTQNYQNPTLSFAYGIAGDSYMAIVQARIFLYNCELVTSSI